MSADEARGASEESGLGAFHADEDARASTVASRMIEAHVPRGEALESQRRRTMAEDGWKCPQCGARTVGVPRCGRCGRAAPIEDPVLVRPVPVVVGARGGRGAGVGPGAKFRRRHAGGTSGPPRVRVAAARDQAPITLPPGKVGGVFRRRSVERDVDKLQMFSWTDEEIIELARRSLGAFDALYLAPAIPPEILEAWRVAHGDLLDDRVLVLFHDTLFGGQGDGFAITPRAFHWKNIGEDPRRIGWDEIDLQRVAYQDDTCALCLDDDEELQLTHQDTEVLAPRLLELVACLAALAQDDA